MKGLNRNQLKYIAIITMIIDHIAFAFIPSSNPIYSICRFFGKLTAPIMCYFLAEGYNYTSSKMKYGLRLFIFSIISQFAFSLAFYNTLFILKLNMIFTLLICFLILLCYDKIKNKLLKVFSIILLIIVSYFSDWGIFAPLWVLGFYIFKGKITVQVISYYISTILAIVFKYILIKNISFNSLLIYFGLFLFIPFMYLYNGQKGNNSKFNKWFFYIFYPLHLLIIMVLS